MSSHENLISKKIKKTLIVESPAMKKILSDVQRVAKSNASVFISGESGTGKEMIAQAIHAYSNRVQHPFITINCAAIPPSLLESEFFGHEKGAFTGAIDKKLGRFERADKGTLLLDEISEIAIELQPKLLRVIQEKEFERVGGIRPIHIDVRLICTSNRLMKEIIEKNLFREDLYYRLNVVPIYLPPLRERKEDILPLAYEFVARICEENTIPLKTLAPSAKEALLTYKWPGNIRELRNAIERSIVMNPESEIQAEDLMLECTVHSSEATHQSITLEDLEKKLILETLEKHKHNRTKTAHLLGISIRTLRNKLNSYKEG